jgi:hypothetical protein
VTDGIHELAEAGRRTSQTDLRAEDRDEDGGREDRDDKGPDAGSDVSQCMTPSCRRRVV